MIVVGELRKMRLEPPIEAFAPSPKPQYAPETRRAPPCVSAGQVLRGGLLLLAMLLWSEAPRLEAVARRPLAADAQEAPRAVDSR